MSQEPTLDQLREWTQRLAHLQSEMEHVYGEPNPAQYDDKLPTLVRYAWEEAVLLEGRRNP